MRPLKCISRLTTLYGSGSRLRSFCCVLAASLLFFSSASNASTPYTWYGSYSVSGMSSPSSACDAMSQGKGAKFGGTGVATRVTDVYFNCHIKYTADYYAGTSEDLGVSRVGDSCSAADAIYNSSSGACDAPVPPDNKCAILKDTAVPSFRFKSTSSYATGIVSKNGCAIKVGPGICVTRTAPLFDCTYSGVITGDALDNTPEQNASDCSGADCTNNQPQKESTDNPCVATASGNGYTCTSSKSEDNPGKSQCGAGGSGSGCVANPKPTSITSKSDISQSVTSNGDGSTTSNTTTTTTTTSCKGIGECTTGTTKTVTTGGTTSTGTNKPPSSTCTGPECNGGKVGGGNGTGNATSGQGTDQPPADESSVAGDMQCAALVSCSGDVIQCAILRQEQQSRCADEKFRDLSDGPVNDAKAAMATEFAGNDYQALKAKGDDVHDFSSWIKTDGFLAKSCPVLPGIDIPFAQFKTRLDFNMSGFCDFLTYLGYINVAFALYKAAEIVGKGV